MSGIILEEEFEMYKKPIDTHDFIVPVLDVVIQQYSNYLRRKGKPWKNIAETLGIIVEDNIEYLKLNMPNNR